MLKKMEMGSRQVTYKFVNFGSKAPDEVADNEFWIDVGGSRRKNVFDHHFENSKFTSTSELVLSEIDQLGELPSNVPIKLVMHQSPDLDSIFSSWLIREKLISARNIHIGEIKSLAHLVSLHDQGFEDTYPVENSWPIAFYTEIVTNSKSESDLERLELGMEFIEKTIAELGSGVSLQNATSGILSRNSRRYLKDEGEKYKEDIKDAFIFKANLTGSNKDSTIIDAIAFINPKSQNLIKHYARRDKDNSPQEKGFILLSVSKSIPMTADKVPMWRHIISVNPESKLELQGLGRLLEEMEQEKEEKLGIALPKGRQRIEFGKGRFGWNVDSPWYDGRGHNHTIIDSPAITLDEETVVASVLAPEEILCSIKETFPC
jgi:hypothetical protein